ncbi:MAG: CHC2 zinc finger domain-containing protein [Gemmatimonadaceae bacterium]
MSNGVVDRMVDRRAETRTFLDEVASRLPLAEVVRQDGVRLMRQGRTYRGPCPIHSGRNPNFVVLPGGQRFYCHKCGVSGDVIDYLQKRTQGRVASFPEALAWLSEATGVALPFSDTGTGMHAETKRDIARHPAALDFTIRFYQAVRDAYRDEYEAACLLLGTPVAIADACGAGLVPNSNRLGANIMRYCESEAWPAFHRLGLVDQRFTTAGSTECELTDRAPTGALIWPLADRGRLAGLAVLDQDGDRIYCTEPGRTIDPRFAVLATPDADFGWSQSDADPSAGPTADTATLWRDARAFWAHAADVPGPHVVPSWHWGTPQDAPRMRTQLRGRDAIGVALTDDDLAWWARGPLIEWVDGIFDRRPHAGATAGIVCHPLEAALAYVPGFDASAEIAEVAAPLRRLVMSGWLAQHDGAVGAAHTPNSEKAAGIVPDRESVAA